MKHCLYWVTKDLRINDNLALHLTNKSDKLLCVYVVEKKWFEATNYQSKPMGDIRWSFLESCLIDFNQQLLALGQQLYIVYGDTLSTLTHLCSRYQITDLITTKLPGTYEQGIIHKIQNSQPHLSISQLDQFTLFNKNCLPFDIDQLPASYSKFRRIMAGIEIPKKIKQVDYLPEMFHTMPAPSLFRPEWLPNNTDQNTKQVNPFFGGEKSGLEHLKKYFSSSAALNYKQVRNELDGWQNSSKISPWLSYGCVSSREIISAISELEAVKGKNSSTESLYLELLWREYFQWLHLKNGAKTYQLKGVANTAPLTSFYPERFKKWCLGNTPYPLVNACMNELRLTGYLSNRGRQLVASCLVNEFSVDWRYGAAWFEERLIDYDAAVNWGNWQYIAGVGGDPRGGRHFNIEKQTELYDSDSHYRNKWTNEITNRNNILDSVDASDWPNYIR